MPHHQPDLGGQDSPVAAAKGHRRRRRRKRRTGKRHKRRRRRRRSHRGRRRRRRRRRRATTRGGGSTTNDHHHHRYRCRRQTLPRVRGRVGADCAGGGVGWLVQGVIAVAVFGVARWGRTTQLTPPQFWSTGPFIHFGQFIWSLHFGPFILVHSFGPFIWSIHLVHSFGPLVHSLKSTHPTTATSRRR